MSPSQQRVSGQALEALHERHPKHPGGIHYLIHAYDNPVLARISHQDHGSRRWVRVRKRRSGAKSVAIATV